MKIRYKKQLSHQRLQGGIHVGRFFNEMMGSKTMQTGYKKQFAICLLRGCMNNFYDDCIMEKKPFEISFSYITFLIGNQPSEIPTKHEPLWTSST